MVVFCVCSRPKEMKDIAYQEEVVKTLIHSIESGNVSFDNKARRQTNMQSS